MKCCVVSIPGFKLENGMFDAITRIPTYVSTLFNLPLIHDEHSANHYRSHKFDVLFVRHGPLVWCPYREIVFSLMRTAGKVIFLENDYAYKPEKKVLELCKEYYYWTTIPSDGNTYVNWNMMSYKFLPKKTPNKKIPGLFYYGTFRKGRKQYFEKYFTSGLYEVNVSTFGKSISEFKSLSKSIKIFESFEDISQIKIFEMALYIGDEKSSSLFCSLANRFYECVSARIPICIDEDCLDTFLKSGVEDAEKFVVSSPSDVLLFLKHSTGVRKDQEHWNQDYFAEFNKMLLKAAHKEGLSI